MHNIRMKAAGTAQEKTRTLSADSLQWRSKKAGFGITFFDDQFAKYVQTAVTVI